MTTTRSVIFGDTHAAPGEEAQGVLRVSEGDKSVCLAAGVIDGSRPGPHFVAIAGHHGAELKGVAAVHSIFGEVAPATKCPSPPSAPPRTSRSPGRPLGASQ